MAWAAQPILALSVLLPALHDLHLGRMLPALLFQLALHHRTVPPMGAAGAALHRTQLVGSACHDCRPSCDSCNPGG